MKEFTYGEVDMSALNQPNPMTKVGLNEYGVILSTTESTKPGVITTNGSAYSNLPLTQAAKEELLLQNPKKDEVSPQIPKEGLKFDQEKPDLSLLSSIAIVEMAKVMTFGKKKYSANNWRGGIAWTRLLAAALRHVFAFSGGETKDPETGLSHLSHAMCCLMMLVEFQITRTDLDDRFKEENR